MPCLLRLIYYVHADIRFFTIWLYLRLHIYISISRFISRFTWPSSFLIDFIIFFFIVEMFSFIYAISWLSLYCFIIRLPFSAYNIIFCHLCNIHISLCYYAISLFHFHFFRFISLFSSSFISHYYIDMTFSFSLHFLSLLFLSFDAAFHYYFFFLRHFDDYFHYAIAPRHVYYATMPFIYIAIVTIWLYLMMLSRYTWWQINIFIIISGILLLSLAFQRHFTSNIIASIIFDTFSHIIDIYRDFIIFSHASDYLVIIFYWCQPLSFSLFAMISHYFRHTLWLWCIYLHFIIAIIAYYCQ